MDRPRLSVYLRIYLCRRGYMYVCVVTVLHESLFHFDVSKMDRSYLRYLSASVDRRGNSDVNI